jgi:hypothetical protein
LGEAALLAKLREGFDACASARPEKRQHRGERKLCLFRCEAVRLGAEAAVPADGVKGNAAGSLSAMTRQIASA